MLKITTFIIWIALALSHFACGADSLVMKLESIDGDRIRVTTTNEGEKTERIKRAQAPHVMANYSVWVESSSGYRNTACHFCDDNWYPAYATLSYWPPSGYKEKRIRLKPGQGYSQEFSLSSFLSSLPQEQTREEIERRIEEGDQRLEEQLNELTNELMEIPVVEALSEENGPFKVRVRSYGIESNFIEISKIEFE